jgi:hypothetical protein
MVLGFGTSVVHGNIEAAKARDGLVDEIAHVVLATDIRAYEFGLGAESSQLSDQCLAGIVVPTGNYDLRAIPSEREGRRATDACEGSCD